MHVDRFGDMGRTTINVSGNTVACLLLFKFGGKGISDAIEESEIVA